MAKPKLAWDNESDVDEGTMSSVGDCKSRCEEKEQCRQYSFNADGRCKTRADPRLGKTASNIESGWLMDRMIQFEQDMAPCGDESWLI